MRIMMRERIQVSFGLLAILAAGMTLSAALPNTLPNDTNSEPNDTYSDESKYS